MNKEAAVNALLEESTLPAHLRNANKKDTTIPAELQAKQEIDTYSTSNRKNIFDNDEFDVFTRKDVDLTRIQMGKRYVFFLLILFIGYFY